jgi:mono/diheme cytochrome c family protein
MSTRASWYALVTAVTLALVPAPRTTLAADADNPGRIVYLKYCGACHGPEARGDGIVSTFMTPRPVDLTKIAKNHEGKFPFMNTMRILDGTNSARAHGDPDMPVWGEIWKQGTISGVNERAEVKGKLVLITEYLLSIQSPPPTP